MQALEREWIAIGMPRYLHEREVLVDDRLVSFSAGFTQMDLTRNTNTFYEIYRQADRKAAEDEFLNAWSRPQSVPAAGVPILRSIPEDVDQGQVCRGDLL